MPTRPNNLLRLTPGLGEGQNGHVLIVDDEPDIRILISRILRDRGYSVLLAKDGEEALSHVARDPIRLILSNIRMPRMSGFTLYDHIADICPMLLQQFVFCSGDIASEESYQFIRDAGVPWLAKPFDLDELLEIVERHVGAPIALEAQKRQQILEVVSRRQRAGLPAVRIVGLTQF